MISNRLLFFSGFIVCLILLGVAAYLQYVVGLEPCPLCIMQRWMLIALSIGLLIAAIHAPRLYGNKIYALVIILLAAIGASIAGRQVWLQQLPPEAQPECGPGFEYLLENFPLTEAFHYIFAGSGECAIVDWTLFGQSLAVWSLLAFLGFMLMGVFLLLRKT